MAARLAAATPRHPSPASVWFDSTAAGARTAVNRCYIDGLTLGGRLVRTYRAPVSSPSDPQLTLHEQILLADCTRPGGGRVCRPLATPPFRIPTASATHFACPSKADRVGVRRRWIPGDGGRPAPVVADVPARAVGLVRADWRVARG